jgi:hypothetical protein
MADSQRANAEIYPENRHALEVNACDAEVRVSQLPLDDHERDALVGHLDRVRVP